MSYLNYPRLCFAGSFQADISTVNNDPRHYDVETFQEHFQDFSSPTALNGWWNPIGTGIFRLSDCTVRSCTLPDGTTQSAPQSNDPVLTWQVGNAPDRPSGKMVDLDPDWQFASQLYGVSVSLMDPKTRRIPLIGDFKPAPFRDLWFSRNVGAGHGESGGSAIFQSVLTNLRWDNGLVKESPLLTALQDGAENGMLSIRLSTFAFNLNPKDPSFAYGTVLGAIGLHRTGNPTTFVMGRRMRPTTRNKNTEISAVLDTSVDMPNLGFMPVVIQDKTLLVDTANATPLDGSNKVIPEYGLTLAVLTNPDVIQGTLLKPGEYKHLFQMRGDNEQALTFSGIRSFTMTDEQIALLKDRPLAVLQNMGPGKNVVALREGPDGLNIQCEDFSFRLDPNDPDAISKTTSLYASKYGVPLAGAKLALWPNPVTPDLDSTPPSSAPGTTPTAPVPFTNTPPDTVAVSPSIGTTDENGVLQVKFTAPKTMGWPRKYLDGQIYTYTYNFVDLPAVVQSRLDQISILAFSSVTVPEQPTWADVQPILQQYANLYPVMSQRMFNFADQAQADANAHLMLFVFQKDILDPDYMPVTRDLSAGRHQILVRYFENVLRAQADSVLPIESRVNARCPFATQRPELADIKQVHTVGKRYPT